MSFPIGIFTLPPPSAEPPVTNFRSLWPIKKTKSDASSESSSSPLKDAPSPSKLSPFDKKKPLLKSRAFSSYHRFKADLNTTTRSWKRTDEQRPASDPSSSLNLLRLPSLDFEKSSLRSEITAQDRRVTSLIPDLTHSPTLDSTSDSAPSVVSGDISLLPRCSDHHSSESKQSSGNVALDTPGHVEIISADWAQPPLEQSNESSGLTSSQAIALNCFAHNYNHNFLEMSNQTPDLSHSTTLNTQSAPRTLYANPSNSDSQAHLFNANSSQSSLVSRSDGYDSTSEAESSQDDGERSHTPSHLGENGSSANLPAQQPSQPANAANLSGLVCNVHRTTGKEPPPLVGATTTVVSDKLYVFGGRKLSRTRPQLTSNLYELDLIKRNWTKLETKGDIPPARYFHSVCALGDRKLVCYGGMSPAPQAADAPPEAQPEIIVMSDIHIFDIPSRTWTRINCQESPQGRYAHCATILPSSAVFASANAPMSALHHNPSGSNPNQGTLGVALDGTGGAEMVVVGGQDSANHYIEQVSVFNLRSLKWTGTMGMGRSCGAYRSVVAPLTTMTASQIGAGLHVRPDLDEEEEESVLIGSGAPMLIYSNYNFLDVKLELQIRLTDGTLTEKTMQTAVSPPGLRFPNGGVFSNHFIVSGTFLTSSKQEYALWALDLRTLAWSRIDAGGSIFSHGSWNRGVLWPRRNAFIILGNRKRSLVDDYNNRRVNFSNICLVELEAFGLYDNPRRVEPTSDYVSVSSNPMPMSADTLAAGRPLLPSAEELGARFMNLRELADMDFLAIDGTRIPVNSRIIGRRWGLHFGSLMCEALASATDTDTATLRPTTAGHPSRISSVTITPSVTSATTTLANNSIAELPDSRSAPPQSRPRLFYLPHTATTLHALVHYLYTSTLPTPPSPLATPQVLCSLLQLARPYKIDGLLEAVVERLHESLDGRNAAAIFNAAAMGAGGGEGLHLTTITPNPRESTIPIRTASLAALTNAATNGIDHSSGHLRVNVEAANDRGPRGPGQSVTEDSEDDVPSSADTDTSMSDIEASLSSHRDRRLWKGPTSAVVGLQKRGLRGLMEGRRMREREKSEADNRVGLGIA